MAESMEALSDAIWAAIGGFVPQDRGELDVFFEDLPDVFTRLAGSLEALGQSLESREVHPEALSRLRSIARTCHQMHDSASAAAVAYIRTTAFWRER